MWIGEYTHSLDEKNRFVLPSRYRQQIKEKNIRCFYLTRGLDRCLAMYDEEEWNRLTPKLRSLPFTKENARKFNRFFFSSAVEIVPDAQGRVIIPDNLREHAEIAGKEIVITGVSDRIEIWSKERWGRMYDEHREDFEKMAEDLFFE